MRASVVRASVVLGAIALAVVGLATRPRVAPGLPSTWTIAYAASPALRIDFHQPRALALAGDELVVADRTGRIVWLERTDGDETLVYRHEWRLPQTRNGFPAALAWDSRPYPESPDGTLLVGETHYGRITRYRRDGRRLATFGTPGLRPGEFARIQGLAVEARDGEIYVTETWDETERVQVFTSEGVWLRMWGGPGTAPGRFLHPVGIALSPSGEVVVADANNHRLQCFTRQGAFTRALVTQHLRYPYGAAVSADGTIFTVEQTGSRVVAFLPDGRVRTWGEPGSRLGQLAQPWNLVVAEDGVAFVGDTRNHRIQSLVVERAGYAQASTEPGGR